MPNPKIAVDLFMIISGFLMTAHVVMRQAIEPMTEKNSWYKFWLRRFFRIAPAYYVSLMLAIVASEYFLGGYQALQSLNPQRWANTIVYDPSKIEYGLENIVLHLTFLFGLHPHYTFSTFLPDWSLSLEMQFYFIFPLLFLLIQKLGLLRSVLSVGLVSILLGFIVSRWVYFYEPSFLLFKLQYFMAGILLYYATISALNKKAILLAFLGLVFVCVEFVLGYGMQRALLPILYLLMLALGWLETHHRLAHEINTLFRSRLVNFMSDSSYSVYLFHGFFISLSGLLIINIPLLHEASLSVHTAFMFVFVVSATYPLAYFMFFFVEKPGIGYGKFMIAHWFPKKRQVV